MKALVLENIGKLSIKNLDIPKPKENEILLRVINTALCRTDAKMYKQGQRDLVLPRILGHEICAQDTNTGNKFVVWPGNSCETCDACKQNAENLCDNMQVLGFHCDGGLAEYVSVSKLSLIDLPLDLSEEIACFAEPLACTINALDLANLTPNQKVLIYGGGTVGLLMALAVRAKQAIPYIVETNPKKIQKAQEFCKNLDIEYSTEAPNRKFDIATNATPNEKTLTEGIQKLKKGGKYSIFSGYTGSINIPMTLINEIHYQQLKMVGAYGCTRNQMKEAIKILSKYQDSIKLLIEDRINLEQVPEALEEVLSGCVLKFIVKL